MSIRHYRIVLLRLLPVLFFGYTPNGFAVANPVIAGQVGDSVHVRFPGYDSMDYSKVEFDKIIAHDPE